MANLQDGVGISGGSTLIGGTGHTSTDNLTLVSTSDATKTNIFVGISTDTIVAGRATTMPINASVALFPGATPKMEIVTGVDYGTFEELAVIRHTNLNGTAVLRRVGLLLKLSDEQDVNESGKSGGMILDSSELYGNNPILSLVTNNQKRLTIDHNGTVTISGDLIVNGIASVAPVASYIFMATATAPAGYLRCDGSAISRSTYAALFAVIGTTYGSGNGTTTFNLPDSRGLFFRDLDSGIGIDPSRALSGTYQNDDFKSHTHSYIKPTTDGSATGNADPHPDGPLISANTGATGGSETRPKNIAIVTFIKY